MVNPQALTVPSEPGILSEVSAKALPAEFLAYLRSGGFEVTARGDRLYVTPREKLTPAEVERVKAMKGGLINLVIGERMVGCEVCRAAVDPAAREDVGRLCYQGGCPYRRTR